MIDFPHALLIWAGDIGRFEVLGCVSIRFNIFKRTHMINHMFKPIVLPTVVLGRRLRFVLTFCFDSQRFDSHWLLNWLCGSVLFCLRCDFTLTRIAFCGIGLICVFCVFNLKRRFKSKSGVISCPAGKTAFSRMGRAPKILGHAF